MNFYKIKELKHTIQEIFGEKGERKAFITFKELLYLIIGSFLFLLWIDGFADFWGNIKWIMVIYFIFKLIVWMDERRIRNKKIEEMKQAVTAYYMSLAFINSLKEGQYTDFDSEDELRIFIVKNFFSEYPEKGLEYVHEVNKMASLIWFNMSEIKRYERFKKDNNFQGIKL